MNDWEKEQDARISREKSALYSHLGKEQVEKFLATGFSLEELIKAFDLNEGKNTLYSRYKAPLAFQIAKDFLKLKAVLEYYNEPDSAHLAAIMTAPTYIPEPDFPESMSVSISDRISVSLREGSSKGSPIHIAQVGCASVKRGVGRDIVPNPRVHGQSSPLSSRVFSATMLPNPVEVTDD